MISGDLTSGVSLLSPESTVTSLLASSGRLRSSLHPEPACTIKYKNRRYDSATQALDAYIADFQQSLHASATSVGELEFPKEPSTPDLLHVGYRNRDVLKDSLSDRELNLLHFTTSDHHSVTTDDLLLLPCDGSLPVTCTSAALSRSGGHLRGCSVNSSFWSRSRPSGVVKGSLHCCPATLRSPCRARALGRERPLCVDDLLTSQHGPPLLTTPLTTKMDPPASRACRHLPRWITSHKSEMDFSGVTSIPDLRYPAWLSECHIPTEAQAGTPSASSWVSELERNTNDGQWETKGSEQATLRELRLQFAETLVAAENGGVSDESREPFRGDRIGFLIQRAEQVLNSPSLGLRSSTKEQQDSSGTEELLNTERSWENPPVTFKSPVPVGGAEEHLTTEELPEDTIEKSTGSWSSGYSSRKHPGPVEALKQMLFTLQAVEQRETQQEDTRDNSRMEQTAPSSLTRAERRQTQEVPQAGSEYESAFGGQSLKRALHHLGRLKSLVDEMSERKSVELQQDI
ncbi:lung adenoma susceptibility protein 2 [Electrophorus electricus]|uniref:lung adenoma susceptibility protein 2 n=1 Tax=Electrophorus electricus TaxID=8005 RepID=UPI0015D0A87B|nr:lung adenoma susceptibility protein 2 [Electrophorus electricus]